MRLEAALSTLPTAFLTLFQALLVMFLTLFQPEDMALPIELTWLEIPLFMLFQVEVKKFLMAFHVAVVADFMPFQALVIALPILNRTETIVPAIAVHTVVTNVL